MTMKILKIKRNSDKTWRENTKKLQKDVPMVNILREMRENLDLKKQEQVIINNNERVKIS